jgi:PAS domain S-box-containing protein
LSALAFASIFYWKVFPDCYVEGVGLTQFKIVSEYIIAGILLASLGLLVKHRNQFDRDVWLMLLCSVALTVISELAFTLYFSVYGPANFLGHYFKIIAFYFIYRAIVETGIRKPYALLSEDLKREREALNKERNFVSTVLDTAGALVVVLDTSGNIVRFNKACEQLTGFSFEEVAAKPFWDLFVAPAELDGVKAVFGRLISGDAPHRHENKWIAKDGSSRLIAWANSVLPDDRGAVEFVVEAGIDITDRKRAEEALEQARDQLELRVKRRTDELVETNKQLEWEIIERKRSQDALEDRAKELSQTVADLERFTYVASHDLQEPFRNVTNCMEILRRRYEDQLGPDAAKLISYAIDSSIRLKELIDGLSMYSRVSARGGPFEPTDCEKMLDRAIAELQPLIRESGAMITHDPLPTVFVDSEQWFQVFVNLLANAIKFNQRSPSVHVAVRKEQDELIFSVTDNGIGIEPQYFDRIFTIFQRLHRSDDYPGTGVGLAVTKKIIERHGGRIWVESTPGKGTTFFFTIPDRAGQLSVSC